MKPLKVRMGRDVRIEINACDVIFQQLGHNMKTLLDQRQASVDKLRRDSRGDN